MNLDFRDVTRVAAMLTTAAIASVALLVLRLDALDGVRLASAAIGGIALLVKPCTCPPSAPPVTTTTVTNSEP